MAAAMRHLQTRLPTWAVAFAIPAEMLETSAGEHLMIRVPCAEAPEDTAVIPVALLAGAVIGAETAVPALGEAALPVALLGAEAAAPILGEASPAAPEPAPVASAPTLRPMLPQRSSAGPARRFWPVPVAVLTLAGLAWGLSGRLPKKSDDVPKGAALKSSGPVPTAAASPVVSPPVQPEQKSGLSSVPSSMPAPVTVKVGAYKEHRVSHPALFLILPLIPGGGMWRRTRRFLTALTTVAPDLCFQEAALTPSASSPS